MPIGKRKTTLTDANRKKENSFNKCQSEKKENSFNRCQSEKTNFKKISYQRNSTIKRLGFPNDATDCILRIRSLTFFSTSPISIKCEQHYSSENTFLFRHIPKSRTLFVLSCNQSRLDIRNLNTEGVNTVSQINNYNRSYSDVEITKSTSSYGKSKQ
jgi:hypothetical protein